MSFYEYQLLLEIMNVLLLFVLLFLGLVWLASH
mgnify:CR=1 FL=1